MFNRFFIKRGFSKLSNSELLVYANRIAAMMAGNSNYTTPTPVTLIDLGTLITTYSGALTAYGITPGTRGTTVQKTELDNARVALENGLDTMAFYCESTTIFNEAAFRSGGWDVTSEPSPVGILGPVRDLIQVKSKGLNFGEIQIDWKRPLDVSTGNVNAYNVYRGATSNFANAEIAGTVTRTRFRESSLTAAFYYYWIIAIGTAGPGALSDVCVVTVTLNPS